MDYFCPTCKKQVVSEKRNGVTVEACPDCRGFFLDKGELNAIAKEIVGDIEYCSISSDDFKHSDKFPSRQCLKCSETMKKADFNIFSDIILDYCAGCKGFWLDQGELVRINKDIERLNALPAPAHPLVVWFQNLLGQL